MAEKETRSATLCFSVWDGEGRLVDDLHEKTPLKAVSGDGKLPGAVMDAVLCMEPGEKKEIAVSPDQGFGPRDPQKVIKVHARELPNPPGEIGERYRRLFEDGTSETYTVQGFVGDWVYLDANHPLAGKDLIYQVAVIARGEGA